MTPTVATEPPSAMAATSLRCALDAAQPSAPAVGSAISPLAADHGSAASCSHAIPSLRLPLISLGRTHCPFQGASLRCRQSLTPCAAAATLPRPMDSSVKANGSHFVRTARRSLGRAHEARRLGIDRCALGCGTALRLCVGGQCAHREEINAVQCDVMGYDDLRVRVVGQAARAA